MDSLCLGIVGPAFIQSFGQLLYAFSFIMHVVGFFFHPVQWRLKVHVILSGMQWLSGRVLDSRPRGGWFESPASLRCVLEQDTLVILAL